MKNFFSIITLSLLLFSCNLDKKSIPIPLSYLDGAESFNVKDFFNESQTGFAVVLDDQDRIISKFNVKSSGNWEGNKGTIKFEYIFSEEKTDFRTWLVTLDDEENYTIVGHDFLEPAKGRQQGNVSELIYRMNSTFNNKKSDYSYTDSIYQVEKDSLIIITKVKHNRRLVGKIISAITKKPDQKISKLIPAKSGAVNNKEEESFESLHDSRG